MNARFTPLLLALLLAGLTACKPTSQDINPNSSPTDTPTNSQPTAIGQPQGTPITQTIGPEGGTMTTPDGKLTLTLPAGALTKATAITIQPITNTAPNGVGQSYQFSPDGLQFVKPATLTLQYAREEVAVNNADMLFMAFQTSDRRWQGVEGSQVDTTRLQISVPMPHFSNWSGQQQAEIEELMIEDNLDNDKGTKEKPLKAGESLRGLYTSSILHGLAPTDKPVLDEAAGEKWSVIGGDQNGQLVKEASGMRYVAPAQAPAQNPVTVMVEISFKNNKGKVYVLKTIYLEGYGYFRGSIDGAAFDWPVFTYNRTADSFYITGSPEANFVPNIQFGVLSGASDPVGFHAYAEKVKAGAATLGMRTNGEVGNGLLNFYYECGGAAPLVLSPGGLQIDKVERNGNTETIEGHLTGTVYRLEGKCPAATLKTNRLEVSFRIPRKVTR